MVNPHGFNPIDRFRSSRIFDPRLSKQGGKQGSHVRRVVEARNRDRFSRGFAHFVRIVRGLLLLLLLPPLFFETVDAN